MCTFHWKYFLHCMDATMYMLQEVKWSLVTHTHTNDRTLFILNLYHANTSVIPEVTSCVQTQHSQISNYVFLISNVRYNLDGGKLNNKMVCLNYHTEHWSEEKSYIQKPVGGYHYKHESCYLNSSNLWEIL